jgi:elongation factor 1 alpha-like protein
MVRTQKLYDDDDLDDWDEEEEEWEEEEGTGASGGLETDAAQQRRCLDALARNLGDAFSDADLWNAAVATNFDEALATAWLIEPPSASVPALGRLSLEAQSPTPRAAPAASPKKLPAKASADKAAARAPTAPATPPPPAAPPPAAGRALNLVVIGHVDAGKSTLTGRLLHECGIVSAQAVERLQREAAQAGKSSFAYAWLLDEDAGERARGLTVDVARAPLLRTASFDVSLLDTPGHRDFVPAMISGAAQADAALLVVNAAPGEFETGLCAQTREHVVLCRSLGVAHALVVVNQIDKVGYAQPAFDALCAQLVPLLADAGFAAECVRYVPCSAFHGDNVTATGGALGAWWRGPTVLQAIERLPPPRRQTAAPARLTVLDAYKSRLGPATLLVRVSAGAVRAKETLLLLPAGELVVVRALTINGQPAAALVDGETGELAVAPAAGGGGSGAVSAFLETVAPQPGWVLCAPHAPATTAVEVEAKVLTLGLRHPLVKGDAVELHAHCACVPATISRLVCLLDSAGRVVPHEGVGGRPRCLRAAQHAIVRVRLADGPICLETAAACRALSRFSLRAGSETLLVGVVSAIVS